MGRPTKCTPKVRAVIADALGRGLYRETAARLAGIGVSTLYSWQERGEADKEAGKTTPFSELLDAIERAEAQGESDLLGMIRDAAPKNWQAAAWMLERKMPGKYGRRDAVKVEHAGSVSTSTPPDLSHLTDDELAEVKRAFALAAGRPADG